jgi:hypothetical protein
VPSPNVQSRRITIGDIGGKWNNKKLNGQECNERLMQTLAKRYMNDKNIFGTECPQFNESKNSIDKFEPADCDSLFVGSLGAGANSAWAMAVMEMGKWYEKNIHEYNQSGWLNCPLIGVNVRKDCSGYVAACLKKFGVTGKPFSGADSPGSSQYLSNQQLSNTLTQKGFKKMTGSPQPFDIMAKNGHVEIYAGDNKSWSWGSCHDGKNGHSGMPAPMNKGPYSVIWRYIG